MARRSSSDSTGRRPTSTRTRNTTTARRSVVRSIYEGLVGLVGSATDEFEGLVAESWEANEDQSVWTFKIRPELTFQDGSPCDSAAVKASYERLLGMNRGAVAVFSRFISDPAQMTTPDPATIVFDCGTPQPLFLTALASTYGPQIVNAKVAMEHEEDGDFGNTWLQLNAEGTGTGGWKLVSFEPGQEVILERNESYWRGWEGNHFERIIIRVVEEFRRCASSSRAGDVDIIDRFSVDVRRDRCVEASPDAHGRYLGQHRGRVFLDDRGGSAGLARSAAGDVLRLPLSGSDRRCLQRLRVAGEQPRRAVGPWLPGGRILLRDRPREGERAARRRRSCGGNGADPAPGDRLEHRRCPSSSRPTWPRSGSR